LALLELLPSHRIFFLKSSELFEIGTQLLQHALPAAILNFELKFWSGQTLDAFCEAGDLGISGDSVD